MTISIKSMRYFVRAVSHGSISRASDELNVAASAIAAAIDQIEAEFQLKLVNRHRSRGITATASGRTMEQKFTRLLEDYDAVMVEGLDVKQALKGEVRIGYYAPVAPAFLPGLLASLTGPEHHITFHLEECDNNRAQEGVLAGDFDLILFVSDGALPQIDYDVLIKAPAYCLLPADHPLAQRPSLRLKDLAGEAIVVLNRPVAVEYYRGLFSEAGHNPATVAYANSTEMVRSLVGAGLGCALLNMVPTSDTSYAGHRLTAVPIADPLPALSLAVGYNKSNPRRIVRHIADACRSYFAGADGQRHIVAL